MKAWLLAVASSLAVATPACAEDYPTHPVRLLVGYSPGGAMDAVARALGQRLSQILKQPFIIENKPGAGGILAATQATKAAADGYTLLVADSAQLAIAPYLLKELPYDPIKDFTPIARAVASTLILISNSKTTNIKTLADLVSQAKASPGTIDYASPGIGSLHHIAMEVFKSEAGINLVHIPYKGANEAVAALLGGQVQVVLSGFTSVAPYAKSGQVNLLAVTTPKRYPGAPDVPAFSEFYKGFDYAGEVGILAPAGVPPEIVAKLSGAIRIALQGTEISEQFTKLGLIPIWLSSQDYADNIRDSLKKFKRGIELSQVPRN